MKKYCEHSGIEIPSDETHAISTDELKAAIDTAKKATPGPWQHCNGFQGFGLIEGVSKQHKVHVIVDDGSYDCRFLGVQKYSDAAHIAQMNPQFAISIMQELIKLREDLTRRIDIDRFNAIVVLSDEKNATIQTLTEANAALTEANKIAAEAAEMHVRESTIKQVLELLRSDDLEIGPYRVRLCDYLEEKLK